jgi:hypothetical protein
VGRHPDGWSAAALAGLKQAPARGEAGKPCADESDDSGNSDVPADGCNKITRVRGRRRYGDLIVVMFDVPLPLVAPEEADRCLAIAQAFAGPPGPGRAPKAK